MWKINRRHQCNGISITKEKKVGVIDLDIRQRTLSRFLQNRKQYSKNINLQVMMPEQGIVEECLNDSKSDSYQTEMNALAQEIERMKSKCNYILIDCPGSNSNLSIHAHRMSDLIITPINESFVDFDLLGTLDSKTRKIKHASIYSEEIWNVRKHRLSLNLKIPDWVVLRNRMTHLTSNNKKKLDNSILELSKRCGFEIIPGLSERTIFKELFILGLTLLDVSIIKDWKFTISHINGRNEVRHLMKSLKIY